MAHLFISHSTRDGAAIAQQLSAALESAGHRCWIAPRDVKPGVPYPGQIVSAIEGSSGLVLVVTPSANESPDVLQEVQLASTARKTIAPVIVSGCEPGPDLRYYLGVRHQIPWSDAARTTTELLRSFPVGSGWAPSLADVRSTATDEMVVVSMVAPGSSKINVIKVVREYLGLGLAEAQALLSNGFPDYRLGVMPRPRAEAFHRDLAAVGAIMRDLEPDAG